MQCDKFEARLHELLDRRSRPERDDVLRAHALSCPECQQVLEAQELLFDGLEFFECPEPSPDFAGRVLSQYQPPQPVTNRIRTAVIAVGAVAAALLLLVIPMLRGGGGQFDNGASNSSLVTTNSVNTRDDQPTIKPNAIENIPSPSNPVGLIADESLARTSPFVDAQDEIPADDNILSSEYRELIAVWTEQLNLIPSDQQMEPVDQISGGLRPIATSFSVAINLLRRTLPVGKEQPPQKPQAGILPGSADPAV